MSFVYLSNGAAYQRHRRHLHKYAARAFMGVRVFAVDVYGIYCFLTFYLSVLYATSVCVSKWSAPTFSYVNVLVTLVLTSAGGREGGATTHCRSPRSHAKDSRSPGCEGRSIHTYIHPQWERQGKVARRERNRLDVPPIALLLGKDL